MHASFLSCFCMGLVEHECAGDFFAVLGFLLYFSFTSDLVDAKESAKDLLPVVHEMLIYSHLMSLIFYRHVTQCTTHHKKQ